MMTDDTWNRMIDETDILVILEIKIFAAHPLWADFWIFLKFFLWILHFGGGISLTFF